MTILPTTLFENFQSPFAFPFSIPFPARKYIRFQLRVRFEMNKCLFQFRFRFRLKTFTGSITTHESSKATLSPNPAFSSSLSSTLCPTPSSSTKPSAVLVRTQYSKHVRKMTAKMTVDRRRLLIADDHET